MRTILIIAIVLVVVFVGFALLDYFGFYIDWKYKFISVAAVLPIIKGIQTFLSDPLKRLKNLSANKKDQADISGINNEL